MTRMDWSQIDWRILDRLRGEFLGGGGGGAAGAGAKGVGRQSGGSFQLPSRGAGCSLHSGSPYWRSREDLANYDFTYGERIGWKWDAVLSELRRRGWAPPATPAGARVLLDWGCGSGVAGRRVLRAFGAENFDALLLWDHSPLARDFAAEAARREFPKLEIATFGDSYGVRDFSPAFDSGIHPAARTRTEEGGSINCPVKSGTEVPHSTEEPFVLVASHVINELPPPALGGLLALARRAEAVIWVEPGTHADSRALVAVREQLREDGDFRVVAPCAHEAACGLLAAGNERHWCHNFAEPPANIFADSNWVKFGKRAGIDLRSLPYSFLALEKKREGHGSESSTGFQPVGLGGLSGTGDPPVGLGLNRSSGMGDPPMGLGDSQSYARESRASRPCHSNLMGESPMPLDPQTHGLEARATSRVIGRPRVHKAHAVVCNCDVNGVGELTLYKRDDPALFKGLERNFAHPPLYVWERDSAAPGRIAGGCVARGTDGQTM